MPALKRYPGVLGAKNVAAITRALEQCGATILSAPDPSLAPFEFSVMLPTGQRQELVCYAFTANKYKGPNRPIDEHRFQIKYGSNFTEYHDIYIDEDRRKLTLMFGVHHELDLFVAVDPTLHNPTRFSVSVEMKESDLVRTQAVGWNVWERFRKPGRRKLIMPLESFAAESLVAFRPERFLDYVAFEAVAQGLETSERSAAAETHFRAARPDGRSAAELARPALYAGHELERLLGLPAIDILSMLAGTDRLMVAVRGRAAEHHLATLLYATPELRDVRHLDEDGKHDFEVTYKNRVFRVECKNVLKKLRVKRRIPVVDFQKTRASKNDPCSRYYAYTQFEILAACLQPVEDRWSYQFVPTNALAAHRKCAGRIAERVEVQGQNWSDSLVEVLDRLLAAPQ